MYIFNKTYNVIDRITNKMGRMLFFLVITLLMIGGFFCGLVVTLHYNIIIGIIMVEISIALVLMMLNSRKNKPIK